MNRIVLFVMAFLYAMTTNGQQTLKIKVIHADTKEILPGATITGTTFTSVVTDGNGIAVIDNVANGSFLFTVSHVGYSTTGFKVTIPFTGAYYEAGLEPDEEEEEVIVQSTRTSRTIQNTPTRVEVISMEEIDEKSNMRPANVVMILHESTGIQMQQTSATSGNASIRIQGLDGRYTQLLKDGFASYGNFASGLSVLEIPPLDLKQVEIIKGPASTLYGGGSIAGVINFVSKTPGEEAVNDLLLNQSNIGQTNIGYFSSGRKKKFGYTLLGMYNKQKAFDVDKDDFTEVPRSSEIIIYPKLFFYPDDNNTVIIGNSFTTGERTGGDVQVIGGKGDANHQYYEENNTMRNVTTAEWIRKWNSNRSLTIKQGLSVFDRHIEVPGYHFDGISYNSFTDVAYLITQKSHSMVLGGNIVYDKFDEKRGSAGDRDNTNMTMDVYFQDTWDINETFKLESGIRVDGVGYKNERLKEREVVVLPRASLLVKYNDHFSSRLGGGLGYKVPTLFTERTETFQYQGVMQLEGVKSERSYGGTGDINYRTRVGELDISVNQLFFYTWIRKPLVLEDNGLGQLFFRNASQPVRSMGFETNAKFIFHHDYKLFLGYTYTDARGKYLAANQFLPLVPRHKLNSALIYEKHGFLKLGLEGYYTGRQYLFNGFETSDYWEFGFMAEKIFKRFSVYINFENFTDTRQSRFKRVSNGPHASPTFDDIWTHTEGFVVNGGIKIRL